MGADEETDFFEEDQPLEEVVAAFNRATDEIVTVGPVEGSISVSSWSISEDRFSDNYVPEGDSITA